VHPDIVVLAGPNGAGKSTAGPALLKDTLGITRFVDADTIARGMSAFAPEEAALAAGKAMLRRLRDLASRRETFAFETTMAGRLFARWLSGLSRGGYRIHVVFLWLPGADMAVERVAERVRTGGHGIPEETIRRRYRLGLENFFRLYRPLATTWRLYDNSRPPGPRLVARGDGGKSVEVADAGIWDRIVGEYEHGGKTEPT
jgi:predicted ABC-type ATPase